MTDHTTLTFDNASSCFPARAILTIGDNTLGGWNFQRIALVDSATCMTVEPLEWWLLWSMRRRQIINVAVRCSAAICFGAFVGFVLALV